MGLELWVPLAMVSLGFPGEKWPQAGRLALGTERLREYGCHLSSNPRGHREREPGKIDDIFRL